MNFRDENTSNIDFFFMINTLLFQKHENSQFHNAHSLFPPLEMTPETKPKRMVLEYLAGI